MKHPVLATLLACMGATSAWAADSGIYLGVGAGQFNVEVDDLGLNDEDFDSDDTVYKIFGGYRFNPMFSIELAYIDLGSPSQTISNAKFETSASGFAPYAILTLPLGPIEAFGRVGYYFYDVEAKVNNSSFLDDSSEDLVYGVGVGLTLFERLNTRLEYELFDIEDTDGANAIWLSGSWRF